MKTKFGKRVQCALVKVHFVWQHLFYLICGIKYLTSVGKIHGSNNMSKCMMSSLRSFYMKCLLYRFISISFSCKGDGNLSKNPLKV